MNKVALDFLLKKREELLVERNRMTERFDNEIREIENAVEELADKRVWDNGPLHVYDDENPDYIKASQEEI